VFPIHQVNAQPESVETVGSKRKFWYNQDGHRYLFKAEERGTGEDWAEKVVCELARELGIPCIDYELAYFPEGNLRGVICANMAPPPATLIMGNQLLGILDREYPKEVRKKFGVPKYTVEAVANVAMRLKPPVALPQATATGVFAGYLMLDALVANQDRHHQNWAAIYSKGSLLLAPTFDHGSSLARNLTDEDRQARLASKDFHRSVQYFSTRALSEFFPPEGAKPLPVIDAFRNFSAFAPDEANSWLAALRELSKDRFEEILANIPEERMSMVTKAFTLELLTTNQNRLLEA
jgi:hypothetical protein